MLGKWCQDSPDTVTTNLQVVQTKKKTKKKPAVSAKHSKTRYACIRNPVFMYRNGQNSEQHEYYECYVQTYFHKPLEKEIDLLSFPLTCTCEM